MPDPTPPCRYRFGVFEADAATGELRKRGVRLKVNAQPFQVLLLLLERPGELLTREDLARQLWPDGTFVDFEHGVNSAINRIREALGDRAANPRFIETLARRGYRFVAPVEKIEAAPPVRQSTPGSPSQTLPPLEAGSANPHQDPGSFSESAASLETGSPSAPDTSFGSTFLATPAQLPRTPWRTVQTLMLLLQAMYLAFYIGALANLPEIQELLAVMPYPGQLFTLLIASAGILIPVRIFLLCAVLFEPPGLRSNFLSLWPFLLLADILWALSPFLLLHHINFGLALACMAILVYSPFAQRALILMGAGQSQPNPQR